MEYRLIQSVSEMEAMAEPWNALLIESASHVPFLRHDYLRTWWQTKGGGEWKHAELALVVAEQKGKLVGIAPFFVSNNLEGEPALFFLGSVEISDYLDVIVRREDLDEFIQGLLQFLEERTQLAFKTLDLYNILDDSPTLEALERAAREQQWSYTVDRLQHSPYIPLPGDWETYLAGIDKKQRHEIRRKMRRVENANQSVKWYIVSDETELMPAAEAFLALMTQDPDKAAFLTEPMRQHMIDTIRCAFEENCLQLAFMEVDGNKAAGYLNFDYCNRIWVYNSGLDMKYREYSPGWVLLGYLLQWAIENHRDEFDFLRGDEDYKYRFGGIDRFVMRAVLRRP